MSPKASQFATGEPDAMHTAALKRARKQVMAIRSFYVSASLYAIVIPFLWVINLTVGGKIWAYWPTLGWGMGLCVHALTVFAGSSFFGIAWEEKKIEELMARENLKVVSREKQMVQAQMRLLQAQIEPHFLFNTLANIQSLIARSPDKAALMMDNFIAYLRESLSASRAQQGTLKQEFDLLKHYLDLIKIRMAERLEYDLNLAPELGNVALAPMLLQPLVENAIKHGLEPKIEGGRVVVRAYQRDNSVMISVEDNGLGFADNADSAGSGVGLANLRERIAVLYDGQARLEITDLGSSTNQGTRVSLIVPVAAIGVEQTT